VPEQVTGGADGDVRLPASPTGRVPLWVIDEASGRPVSPVPWRAWQPPAPRTRRGSRLRGPLAIVLVLALSLAATVLIGPGPWPWNRGDVVASAPPTPGRPTDRPLPGTEAAPTPLGTPPPAPAGGGAYAFVTLQADGVTPVAYDPCRPVHYVLRPDAAPAGGEEIIHAAVTRLGQVTGLQFVYDGPTDEPMGPGRPVYQPERYGDRWAPVLIGWQTEQENPSLAEDVVGEAGSVQVSLGDGPRVYVTGTVSLDATQLPQLLAERNGPATVEGIVLHELGHLVGLAHVEDGTQLMYPEAQRGIVDYQAGDLTGLALLGIGQCVPDL
jgi:hypothetical protein